MHISYNPLWKLLIDRGMNKKDLRELSGISTSSIAKLGKGENITTDVLLKICTALNCQISDILETITDEDVENNEIKIHQEDSNG
ncbi:helix-turn-helix domain-containing protein [Ligilactobacillus salivarius]|uniref:Helix-turn-helix transcriptional regulator n=1 Tax=Ligilactobacillus salivarius TaxID=1624 RepID=A0AAW6Q393_9LACO|nr:helix-turn-helix transcriptional regulator [Ligilactobacillus salivarius]MDF4187004.1 helix-turn-helix transcriptional regulator [Ligilactobacillus salivarius]WII29633.1 helix-turn-helix transcriptional regulator [Ligilactobacillus salivarius]